MKWLDKNKYHKPFHSPDWWGLDEWVYCVCSSKGVFECCSKLTEKTTHKTAQFPKIIVQTQKRKKTLTNMQTHKDKKNAQNNKPPHINGLTTQCENYFVLVIKIINVHWVMRRNCGIHAFLRMGYLFWKTIMFSNFCDLNPSWSRPH